MTSSGSGSPRPPNCSSNRRRSAVEVHHAEIAVQPWPQLSGYARALGEHPAGLGRARVLRAFRAALAASAGAPLVSFDVADSLADWASRNQLWPQTAQAY